MNIAITGIIEPDEDKWTASCPELDVHTCGDTKEDALESLKEAVIGYLEAIEECGRMEELLHAMEARPSYRLSVEKPVGKDSWQLSPVG